MRFLSLVFTIMLSAGLSAEVYRSVDEEGNVVFTDKPSADAELVDLDEVQTIRPPRLPDTDYSPPKKPEAAYTEVSIISPQNDQAIRNDAGNVTVNVAVKPALLPADNLVLYLDGKEIQLGKATAKAFSGLDRGTHQLRAAVKDNNGRIQLSSSSVSFHLLRNTVKKKQAR